MIDQQMGGRLLCLVQQVASSMRNRSSSHEVRVCEECVDHDKRAYYLPVDVDGTRRELRIARKVLPADPRVIGAGGLQKERGWNGEPKSVSPTPTDALKEMIREALEGFIYSGFTVAHLEPEGVFPNRSMRKEDALEAAVAHPSGLRQATGHRLDDEPTYQFSRSASGAESLKAWMPNGQWVLLRHEPLGIDWHPCDWLSCGPE